MRPNTIRLNKKQHADFLLENRHDPVTGELLKEGDEVVVCKKENIAYLSFTWKNQCPNKECGCKKTLRHLPASRSSITFGSNKPEEQISSLGIPSGLLVTLLIGVIVYYVFFNSENKVEESVQIGVTKYSPEIESSNTGIVKKIPDSSLQTKNQIEELQNEAKKLISSGCLMLPTRNCNRGATDYLTTVLDQDRNNKEAQRSLYNIIRNRQIEACKQLHLNNKNTAIKLYNKTQDLLNKYTVFSSKTALRFSKLLRTDLESNNTSSSFTCEDGRREFK